MTEGIYSRETLVSIITALLKKYRAERAILFGSYARGESTPSSDVDLRIDKGNVRGLQMAYLLSDLEDALKLPVDLLSTAALDERFLQSIKGEEKLMYERI